MMTTNMPEIMNLTEVASVLRIRRAVAWRLAKSGKLPFFRVGKAYRVTCESLEKFIHGEGEKT